MAFAIHGPCSLTGIFTCRCPGENTIDLARILITKGAEAIHFCTCTFAHKINGKWTEGEGLCDHVDEILMRISEETGVPCIKGTAHLPQGYTPKVYRSFDDSGRSKNFTLADEKIETGGPV